MVPLLKDGVVFPVASSCLFRFVKLHIVYCGVVGEADEGTSEMKGHGCERPYDVQPAWPLKRIYNGGLKIKGGAAGPSVCLIEASRYTR